MLYKELSLLAATTIPLAAPPPAEQQQQVATQAGTKNSSVMEHELLQMLHLPPHDLGQQDQFTVSAGFFNVHGDAHFPGSGGGFVGTTAVAAAPPDLADDDCSWVEDLMQLGDDLFGGAGCDDIDNNAAGADEGNHRQPWQWNVVGSSDDPPPSMSLDAGDGSPPSVEQEEGTGELASDPHRDDDGGDGASPVTRKRRDRSKTIVSERKRRVRMKEKLYELRSLVPNITKMDKASIIADAVVYVKNLQAHARNLKEEVAALEARPRSPSRQEQQQQQHNRRPAAAAATTGRRRQERDEDDNNNGTAAASGARVTHVGAAQVGEGRFFVTVECERRDGVAAPLCAAVESLACFRVETSSLVRSGTDRVVSTLTLKVKEQVGDAAVCEVSVVKLLVMAALLKEGFRPEAAVEIIS